jgi:PKHD-type hydroxylase
MIYHGLSNAPNERMKVTYPWITWDGAFAPHEIDAIVSYCERGGTKEATVLDGSTSDIRRSLVQFHHWNDETAWIFRRLNETIEAINARWYGFALNGYDSFQYTTYDAGAAGHYGWHMDACLGSSHLPADMIEPRKLSLSLLLSEPDADYKGGDFQFNLGNEDGASTAECRKGRIIAFPSWVIHRVTPVMQGIRRSLVVWVTGPKFV